MHLDRRRVFIRLSFLFSLVLTLVAFNQACCFAQEISAEAVNQAIRESGANWVAQENEISRLPMEEKVKLLGAQRPDYLQDSANLGSQEPLILPEGSLPPALDWRNNGGNYVTPVRNQKSCGSCWAFSSTGALESAVLRAANAPGVDLDLSEQVLVSCAGLGGCNGEYIENGMAYIQSAGLPLENCFKYTAKNSACSACSTYLTNVFRASGVEVVVQWQFADATALKNAIATYCERRSENV